MPSFGDDDDLGGSQDGSSENELDDTMRDGDDVEADAEPEPEPEPEPEAEAESPSNSSQGSDDQRVRQNPEVLLTSPSPRRSPSHVDDVFAVPTPRPETLTAGTYDIVPTMAAPHGTSINAIAATPDMRWVLSGGSDGYIRKFNWVDTVNGKLMLTVAQRHPFVDSVTKAGVVMTYWENFEPASRRSVSGSANSDPIVSPVYSLAIQSQGIWLLSGLESGGINLQSIRHDCGKNITCLQKHTSAVSALTLAHDEKSVLSGSWDKNILDWDLNTGQVKRTFQASAGQISAIELRPMSNLPVPEESNEPVLTNGTFSSNTHVNGSLEITLPNGIDEDDKSHANSNSQPGPTSPRDSLFGGDHDSLFGDDDTAGAGTAVPPGDGFGVDDDDEFSRAIANDLQQQGDEDAPADVIMTDADDSIQPIQPAEVEVQPTEEEVKLEQPQTGELPNGISQSDPEPLINGLPHAEETSPTVGKNEPLDDSSSVEAPPASDTTFLAASMDGTLRVWDKRQPTPVARILPQNVPPWCMSACWSPDGNYIYAGRRNAVVEEFSLHKGLRSPERTFRFPQESGKVSALKAMPNGRHLLCASFDILRLYDLKEPQSTKHSTVPFLIVPGHRTGIVSTLYMDPACRYMISTGGDRGWDGPSTEVLLGYEIGVS